MSEPMTITVEIWPLAADSAGIWLVSGNDAWRSAIPVMADSEPHAEVELVLSAHSALDDTVLLHSTSWRTDGPRVLLTYVGILQVPSLVRDRWPEARPVSPGLATATGKPPQAPAVEPPSPRYIDVLFHAVRHLRFLRETDRTANAAMDRNWQTHLDDFEPALAGMYQLGD